MLSFSTWTTCMFRPWEVLDVMKLVAGSEDLERARLGLLYLLCSIET